MAIKKTVIKEKPKVQEEKAVVVSGPKWVKVTAEELAKLQTDDRLMGYNPETGEALIK
jgi:hypothetical protein